MKQTITKYELEILDAMAVAADRLEDARRALVEAIDRLLLVDGWDERAQGQIADYIRAGAGESLEALLRQLGVAVADPLNPDT